MTWEGGESHAIMHGLHPPPRSHCTASIPYHIVLLYCIPPRLHCTAVLHHSQITLYCIADSFDRVKLEALLKVTYSGGSVLSYPDCFYIDFVKSVAEEPGSGAN